MIKFTKWINEVYKSDMCYECIKINKTEQDWSSNQFVINASEFSV